MAKINHELIANLVELKLLGTFDLSGNEFSDRGIDHVANQRNKRKNAALYVSFDEGAFRKPSDVITHEIAQKTVKIAETTLAAEADRRQRMPRFSEREIGSLSHLSKIDDIISKMTESDIRDLDLDKLFSMLREPDDDSGKSLM